MKLFQNKVLQKPQIPKHPFIEAIRDIYSRYTVVSLSGLSTLAPSNQLGLDNQMFRTNETQSAIEPMTMHFTIYLQTLHLRFPRLEL